MYFVYVTLTASHQTKITFVTSQGNGRDEAIELVKEIKRSPNHLQPLKVSRPPRTMHWRRCPTNFPTSKLPFRKKQCVKSSRTCTSCLPKISEMCELWSPAFSVLGLGSEHILTELLSDQISVTLNRHKLMSTSFQRILSEYGRWTSHYGSRQARCSDANEEMLACIPVNIIPVFLLSLLWYVNLVYVLKGSITSQIIGTL